MSRFKPVDPPVSFDGRVSQTALRHFARCARSAALYQSHKGTGTTPEMQRGSALHAVHERAVKAALEQEESRIPWTLVKTIADEVLADPEFHVPLEEHDYVREMAFRLGEETVLPDPSRIVACEDLFVMDVGGYEVRCRIDYAELRDDAVYVADYKSSKGAPGFEEIARKRSDGSLAAKSMQLILYALVLAYGERVVIEGCPACNVTGWADWDREIRCPQCDGKGYLETRIAAALPHIPDRFDLEFVYPGIEDREGKVVRRPVTLTRLELEEYRSSLDGLLTRLRHAEDTGDWPAVASDAACAECPAPALCPIPTELRDFRGGLNTVEEASELAERLHVEKRLHAARQRQLREFAKARGVSVPFGDGMEMRLVYGESEVIKDREGLWDAVQRSARFGEPFDRSAYVRVQGRTDFKAVRVTEEDEAA